MESCSRLQRDGCLAWRQEHISAFASSLACGQLPGRTGGSNVRAAHCRQRDEGPSLSCATWSFGLPQRQESHARQPVCTGTAAQQTAGAITTANLKLYRAAL